MNWIQWIINLFRPHPAPEPEPPLDPQGQAAAFLAAHNSARAFRDLSPLSINPLLQRAATTKALNMAHSGVLSHAGFPVRIVQTGYAARALGENIAEGQASPQEAVSAWLNDAPHRANVLGPYSDLGAAGCQDSAGTWFWCCDYGQPAS